MLIDTHAHLYWESFEKDLDQVIQRSIEAGVSIILNVGVDVTLSEKALIQVKNEFPKYPNLETFSTIGIHPHEAVKYFVDESIREHINRLEEIYKSNTKKVVAVGECGLDFAFSPDYMQSPDGTTLSIDQLKELQIKLFQAQIDLAKDLKLSLIVHCRDDRLKDPQNSEAWDKVLEMIGTHPAILHCYSGLPSTTSYLLQTANFLVSFAATITYPKNEYLREAIKILPLEKIVLETDCPFLSPQSKRGQRNEPETVREIAKLIAQIKGVTLEEVASITTSNVKSALKI